MKQSIIRLMKATTSPSTRAGSEMENFLGEK